jgi:hypothetical protein
MNTPDAEKPKPTKRMMRDVLITGAILGAFFAAAVWFAFRGWNMVPGEMNASGYVIMVIGLLFLALLGGGLMALLFWSHRKGYDR